MAQYKTKSDVLKGTDYKEISKKAFLFYNQIRRKTKRRPYIRSAYFKKDKIFLGLFWNHLQLKNIWDRVRRMKYIACGIELARESTLEPISKENPNKPGEILHRFAGKAKNGDLFFVQIKEIKRSGEKWLVSIFPFEK